MTKSFLQKIPKLSFAVKKIILRTIKLLFWGIILQGETLSTVTLRTEQFHFEAFEIFGVQNAGGYSHAPNDLTYGIDMKLIRWCGILQVNLLLTFLTIL